MNYKNYIKLAFLTLVLIESFTSYAYASENINPEEVYKTAWKILNEKFYLKSNVNLNKWQNKFENKIKTPKDAHLCINKLVQELHDPYTRFLTKEEFNEEQNIINSKLTGIGVKLATNKPLIIDVLPQSPACESGIKTNDYILKINNKSTHNLTTNQITSLLRGEKDSTLTVKLKRGRDVLTKTLMRKDIQFKAVSGQLLENNIAFIKIDSLIPENTSKLFKDEITKLMSASGIILDLRNNSGGLLKNAIEIADMFLNEGKIVSTVSPYGKINELANSNKLSECNIVILVNERTASASEILAGALKENNRAIVLGKKTFGKGLVQEIIKLPDDSALHVTIASYLTPSGKNINKIGLIPNEIIHDENRLLKRARDILINTDKTQIAAL